MFANRSLLAGGDSCYCNCIIRVLREVCLNGVVSHSICDFCCCPLLPKYRQLGMTIGELCWFVVRLDLDLGNKISPLIRARGAAYNHLFRFLQGSWSLLWAVFPIPMSPHHIIGLHCSW